MRASAYTPVSRHGTRIARFSRCASLPHIIGRSTLTSPVSEPAQRSLLVPARIIAELLCVAR